MEDIKEYLERIAVALEDISEYFQDLKIEKEVKQNVRRKEVLENTERLKAKLANLRNRTNE
ncbi:MAG TPA: hypothetical protein VIY47_09440 [Ignavibacteriaceae bacterium]